MSGTVARRAGLLWLLRPKLRTKVNRAPWQAFGPANPDPLNNQVLELYNLSQDFTQSTDLAVSNPRKVKEMKQRFIAEARKYQVFPLDASVAARIVAPRPNITAGRTEFVYTRPMTGLPQGDSPFLLNTSYTITADIEVPTGGAEGMILTSGGRFVEAIVAPSFDEAALRELTQGPKWGKSVRLLACGPFGPEGRDGRDLELKRVIGGFLLQMQSGIGLEYTYGLIPLHDFPYGPQFRPWQLVTYSFLHGDYIHLFFNMFALYMFGQAIEELLGTRRFVVYYFTCVITAALTQLAVQEMLSSLEQRLGNPG